MPNDNPETAPETSKELKQNRRAQLRLKLLSERDIIEKGVIYSAYSRRNTVFLTIPLALIALFIAADAGYVVYILILALIHILDGLSAFASYIVAAVGFLLFAVVPALVEILLFKYIVRGYACDYEANHVQFCITRKGKPIMSVIYKNVESVEYKPMKYLWFEQGFHVTVKMKSYSLKFDYVVPRAMRFHHENFPFEIIIREIVRREIGEQNAE